MWIRGAHLSNFIYLILTYLSAAIEYHAFFREIGIFEVKKYGNFAFEIRLHNDIYQFIKKQRDLRQNQIL